MKAIFSCIVLISLSSLALSSAENRAYIESVRKNGGITAYFPLKPEKDRYDLLQSRIELRVIFVTPSGEGFRVTGEVDAEVAYRVKAGDEIEVEYPLERRTADQGSVKKEEDPHPLKKTIVSETDGREMVLITSSYFWFGSDTGMSDESPRQMVHLDSFYIDKYEVSNEDYLLYIEKTNTPYPVSWNGVKPHDRDLQLPVIVTYYEAERYSSWTGKRLPTEEEWEKSAAGSIAPDQISSPNGYMDSIPQTLYSWGDTYAPDRCNCYDYWDLKRKKDARSVTGLLPVREPLGISGFGVFNIAGNAPEWTSSWYDAHYGSRSSEFRYGTQVKVVKGGAFYSKRQMLRIQSRDFGGIPNLEEDACAGFRCVRSPIDRDRLD